MPKAVTVRGGTSVGGRGSAVGDTGPKKVRDETAVNKEEAARDLSGSTMKRGPGRGERRGKKKTAGLKKKKWGSGGARAKRGGPTKKRGLEEPDRTRRKTRRRGKKRTRTPPTRESGKKNESGGVMRQGDHEAKEGVGGTENISKLEKKCGGEENGPIMGKKPYRKAREYFEKGLSGEPKVLGKSEKGKRVSSTAIEEGGGRWKIYEPKTTDIRPGNRGNNKE